MAFGSFARPRSSRVVAPDAPKLRVIQGNRTTTYLFSELGDRELIDVTKRLAGEETRATAALLRALIEVDARRLYLAEGCASMFVWCTRGLHLCEGGAYNRIEVARAARTYPLILGLVEEGAITLTAVRLLAPHLTPANHAAVLAAARHRSKREVEVLIRTGWKQSRHIPAAVRREVWTRDEGRCAFIGHHGRCTEIARLEFHHVMPHAVGGPATAENIALRCRAHNAHEARLFFGT